eukprot:Colp12_sorted_trinity150504_noHs@29476
MSKLADTRRKSVDLGSLQTSGENPAKRATSFRTLFFGNRSSSPRSDAASPRNEGASFSPKSGRKSIAMEQPDIVITQSRRRSDTPAPLHSLLASPHLHQQRRGSDTPSYGRNGRSPMSSTSRLDVDFDPSGVSKAKSLQKIDSEERIVKTLSVTDNIHEALSRVSVNATVQEPYQRRRSVAVPGGIFGRRKSTAEAEVAPGLQVPYQVKPKTGEIKSVGPYDIIKPIGKGSFSHVKLGINRYSKQTVALKFLSKKSIQGMSGLAKEISLLQFISHPNIVRIENILDLPAELCVVMEYVPQTLRDYINSKPTKVLRESRTRGIFQQIVAGVEHMHRHRVVHRDLKPDNILIDKKKNVKIIDFGFSKYMNVDDMLATHCGSGVYAAPELLKNAKYLGYPVDVWSMGVILFNCFTGAMPYNFSGTIMSLFHLYETIHTIELEFPGDVPPLAQDLIRKMMRLNVDERITIEGIQHHPWFDGEVG